MRYVAWDSRITPTADRGFAEPVQLPYGLAGLRTDGVLQRDGPHDPVVHDHVEYGGAALLPLRHVELAQARLAKERGAAHSHGVPVDCVVIPWEGEDVMPPRQPLVRPNSRLHAVCPRMVLSERQPRVSSKWWGLANEPLDFVPKLTGCSHS
ncbi:hypothetical protein GCM10022226_64650 [Sphaerisporangium flaviroseum]|uniref:Uncharacterized protein n=1 Tax=Sphaerisporangium flaviroseum TaxID=509199 RepID=A0ABP7J5I7_9ACTN